MQSLFLPELHGLGDFLAGSVDVKSGGQWVFVAGQVGAPKAISWEGHLTVLQAIAAAGGKTDKADMSRVVIVRRGPFEPAQWMQTDLASPLKGKDLKNDVALRSGDVVVVPMSGIAKLGVFVQQVLRDLNPMYGTYTITLGSASGAFAAPTPLGGSEVGPSSPGRFSHHELTGAISKGG